MRYGSQHQTAVDKIAAGAGGCVLWLLRDKGEIGMDRIIEVTAGKGGNAYLLMGDKKTALLECGMAYCGAALIGNIRQILQQKPLDYILITHSHYDHVGALPYIKKEWPGLKVLGAEYARKVFQSRTALKTIKQLSRQAAKHFHAGDIEEYDDALMKLDHSISDGDVLDLGGLRIKVIETLGHTKCSLSFLINNDILFASESTGYMNMTGEITPCFLTSCSEAIKSIKKCQAINPRFIIPSHLRLTDKCDTFNYWEKCLAAVEEAKTFILQLADQGYEETQIFTEFENRFRDEQSKRGQPNAAYRINLHTMVKTVLREAAPELSLAQ
ncbi:MAG: beta-lactamase domain protein [Firmicutes bacterium]|nr:beta-lactamase domain protein [Bacillota bacterium]